MKQKRQILWAFLAFTVLTWASTANAKTVAVVGQNDEAVDRQNIQDAIESSPDKNLKVLLKGTFQLDGTSVVISRSNLTLQGVGATLLGLLNDKGLPLPPPDPSSSIFNRGIEVVGPELIENIVIKGLVLSGFTKAIRLRGSSNNASTAPIDNIVIKNNQIQNVSVGLESVGGVSKLEAKGNTVTGAYLNGMYIEGLDGSLSNSVVKNNVFIISVTTDELLPLAFQILGTASDVLVKNNVISGGLAAVALFSPGTSVRNVVLTKNLIRDGGSVGLNFLRGGGVLFGSEFAGLTSSGFVVKNNSYENNQAIEFFVPPPNPPRPLVPRDVWLEVTSDDNFVKEKLGTIVLDDGTNNTVILY